MAWIRRLFDRPEVQQSIQKAENISDTARGLRFSMIQETKASLHAQREEREQRRQRDPNWIEDDLLQRLERTGGYDARFD